MSKPALILIGAGGHAHACIDVVEQQGHYRIAGVVGMPEELHDKHLGYEVIATDDDLPQLTKDYPCVLIAVGQIGSPERRIRIYQQVTRLGFQLPVIIAPSAHVSTHAAIGEGTIIMHGAIVNAGARVGNNCIINTRAVIEHDATVGEACHVSTGAILNGNVAIGDGCFVGSGSLIRDGVTLGKSCFVGMGFAVTSDQADHARLVRSGKQ